MSWVLQFLYQSVKRRICTARANWSPVSSTGTKTSFLKVSPMAIRGVRTSGAAVLPAGDLPNPPPNISYKALKTHQCCWTWFLSEFLPEILVMPAASSSWVVSASCSECGEGRQAALFICVLLWGVSRSTAKAWCFEKGSPREKKKKKTTIPSAHSQTLKNSET